jgi:hypothetical protein
VDSNNTRYNSTAVDGVATFNNLPKGITYTLTPPNVTGYVKPPENKSFTAYDSDTQVNLMYKYIDSGNDGDRYGIRLLYIVNNVYKETVIGSLTADPDSETNPNTLLDPDGDSITKENAIAFHIYTKILADNGLDYFIKVEDLTSEGAHSGSLRLSNSNSDVTFSNIPSTTIQSNTYNYFLNNASRGNGKLYTHYILKYSNETLNVNSPAAEWAIRQSFNYKGQILHGFIGSRLQITDLYDSSNSTSINRILRGLGYTSEFINRITASSNQNGIQTQNRLTSGSWTSGGSHKYDTAVITPFFSTTPVII